MNPFKTRLTWGALSRIYQGEDVVEPLLQVLGYRPISDQERFRLLLSDGRHSSSFSLLDAQLNHLIHENKLTNNSIIRLKQHRCNQMGGKEATAGKRVIIVEDLEVVSPGDVVKKKIGSPVKMGSTKESVENKDVGKDFNGSEMNEMDSSKAKLVNNDVMGVTDSVKRKRDSSDEIGLNFGSGSSELVKPTKKFKSVGNDRRPLERLSDRRESPNDVNCSENVLTEDNETHGVGSEQLNGLDSVDNRKKSEEPIIDLTCQESAIKVNQGNSPNQEASIKLNESSLADTTDKSTTKRLPSGKDIPRTIPKEADKCSERLPRGQDYKIVCVHIETFRSSRSASTKLTQVGCSTVLSGIASMDKDSGFFRAIKPRGVDKYLDNYTVGGDLLQALHMTREDDGTFQFRGQFEIQKDPNKIVVCVSEKAALADFWSHLASVYKRNVILVAVDENSLAFLVKKLKVFHATMSERVQVELKETVMGFTYWRRLLKHLDVPGYQDLELEEFFNERKEELKNIGGLGVFLNAKDISKVLGASLENVLSQFCKKKKKEDHLACLVSRTCKRLEDLPKPNKVKVNTDTEEEHIEVINSYRPSVSTNISVKKREMVSISSDSEDDGEWVEDTANQVPQVKTEIIMIDSDSDEEISVGANGENANLELMIEKSMRNQSSGQTTKAKPTAMVAPRQQQPQVESDPLLTALQLGYPDKPQVAPGLPVSAPLLTEEERNKFIHSTYGNSPLENIGRQDMVQCEHCTAKVKETNMDKHMNKVHSGIVKESLRKKTSSTMTANSSSSTITRTAEVLSSQPTKIVLKITNQQLPAESSKEKGDKKLDSSKAYLGKVSTDQQLVAESSRENGDKIDSSKTNSRQADAMVPIPPRTIHHTYVHTPRTRHPPPRPTNPFYPRFRPYFNPGPGYGYGGYGYGYPNRMPYPPRWF